MSVGNNIIDVSRDLIISAGHNITYLSINYYASLSFFLDKNMTVVLLFHHNINCMTIPLVVSGKNCRTIPLCGNFSNSVVISVIIFPGLF